MAAPFHRILSKTDRALVAYLIAGGAGTSDNVFPARKSIDRKLPMLVAFSDSFTPVEGAEAISVVKSSIISRSEAAIQPDNSTDQDQELAADALAANAYDLFYSSDDAEVDPTQLADAITSAARDAAAADPTNNGDLLEFKCDQARVTGGALEFNSDQGCWEDSITLELIVRPSDQTEP
jgi:hypothetical protein